MSKHITSHEHFVSLMTAHKAHHLSGAEHTPSLHSAILFDANTEVLPEDSKGETLHFEQSVQDFNNNQMSGLTETTEKLKSDKDLANFKKEMENRRQKALEDSKQQINAYYDKMTKIGVQHPGSRSAILVLSGRVMNYFNGIVAKIQKFVTDLVSNIVEWIDNVAEKIVGFFSDIGDKVSNFFGSIF